MSQSSLLVHFVVPSFAHFWPFYAEVPYAAWPVAEDELLFDSFGDCRLPYDREWTWLRATYNHEMIHVLDADPHPPRQGRSYWSEPMHCAPSQLAQIPPEYRRQRDALIVSEDLRSPQPAALVARRFMIRQREAQIWDVHAQAVITLAELEMRYLQDAPLTLSDARADEIALWFTRGAAWHLTQPWDPARYFWWKSPGWVIRDLQAGGGWDPAWSAER